MKLSQRIALLIALPAVAGGVFAFQAGQQPGRQGAGEPSGADARPAAPGEAARIAVLDPVFLVRAALATEENVDRLIARQQEFVNELTPLQAEAQTAIQELQQIGSPQDPNAQQAFQRAQRAEQRFQQARQQADQAFGQFSAELAREAYETIRREVQALAAERGYEYVLSSRLSGDLLTQGGLGGLSDEILARPVMVFPEAANITEEIRRRLDLPNEEEIQAAEAERQQRAREVLQGAAPQAPAGGPGDAEPTGGSTFSD